MSRRGTSSWVGPLLVAVLASACAIEQPPRPLASPTPVPPELPEATIAYMLISGDEYPGAVIARELDDGSERTLTDVGYPVAMTLDDDAVFVAEPVVEPQQRLVLYPLDGGAPATLLDAVFMAYANPTNSPDGRYVALGSDGAVPNGLVVLDLEAGSAAQLTEDGASGVPLWSPDSRWIAYQVISPGTGSIDVFVIDVESGERRPVSTELATETAIGWTDDSTSVIVWSQQSSGLFEDEIARVDVATGAAESVEASPAPRAATSPDDQWELWAGANGTELRPTGGASADARLLPDSQRATFTWSPDGEWLIWSGRADGRDATKPDLYALHLPDGEPIRVTQTEKQEVMPVWGGTSTSPTS